MLAIHDAQNEYASVDRDGDGVRAARRLVWVRLEGHIFGSRSQVGAGIVKRVWIRQHDLGALFPPTRRYPQKEVIEAGKKAFDWDKKWHPPGTRKLPNGRMHGLAFTWTHEWDDSAGTCEVAMCVERTHATLTILGCRADGGQNAETSYAQVAADIFTLLNVLAWAGNNADSQKAKQALNAGLVRIPEIAEKTSTFQYDENISFIDVGRCLDKLSASSFRIKQSVVDACAHCAFFDREVTVSESDLLRVVSLALGCPLPPFLP